MSFHVGQTFADYSITALLSSDGMAQVFKVEHSLTQRTEVMKVLSTELASEIQIKRFEREMRSLGKLSHPNITALHNAVHSDDQLVFFMEYVEGQTLESMLRAGRLELDTGIRYIKQMLLALAYAHKQGVVHRDITPANVMVIANGQVKLTDFGLSKSYGDPLLTNCGDILGSLPYLAPEQLKGKTHPDRRSDLYSVGAILYELLTGRKPFGEKRRLAEVLTDSEKEPPAPSTLEPKLSVEWNEILKRALARDPARRYQSAEEFLNVLAQFDEMPTGDVQLSRLGTLGMAAATFAGLVLAVTGFMAVGRFREAMPVVTPWNRLHISPPNFALVVTPPRVQVAHTTPRRAERSATKNVENPILTASVEKPTSQASAGETTSTASVDQTEPENAETADNPVPVKKSFWKKLNLFRKRMN